MSLNKNIKETTINNTKVNLIKINSGQTKINKILEKDNIYLFTQFYIPKNVERIKEIKETLRFNIQHHLIKKIILINERKYTKKELGVNSDKIIQIVKGKRMTFFDVFRIIEKVNLSGYIMVANSDIFFNGSLINVYKSNLIYKKKIFSLLRNEYNKNNIRDKQLFYKGYNWSSDCWIFHTNNLKYIKNLTKFNIEIGVGGVDNIIPYYFYINNFEIFNEPLFIQIFHNHHNNYRTWDANKLIKDEKNYLSCVPNINNKFIL